jgi:Leucine-rich repeat (LRR) protein
MAANLYSEIVRLWLTIFLLVLFTKYRPVTADTCSVTVQCEGCQCFDMSDQKIGLICNNYTTLTIPWCITSDVVYISIREGDVNLLDGNEFNQAPDIQTLEIENNVITYVNPSVLFGNLPHLKDLILPGNLLRQRIDNVVNSSSLQTFDLSRNQLNGIDDDALILPNLKMLDVSHNLLTVLVKPFQDLYSIEELRLTGNALTKVMADTFKPCGNLRTLLLDRNKIDAIENTAFDETVNLETLNLYDNMLSDLPGSLFEYCHSLKSLDLSYNVFTTIPTEALKNSATLQLFNMDQNNRIQVRNIL